MWLKVFSKWNFYLTFQFSLINDPICSIIQWLDFIDRFLCWQNGKSSERMKKKLFHTLVRLFPFNAAATMTFCHLKLMWNKNEITEITYAVCHTNISAVIIRVECSRYDMHCDCRIIANLTGWRTNERDDEHRRRRGRRHRGRSPVYRTYN